MSIDSLKTYRCYKSSPCGLRRQSTKQGDQLKIIILLNALNPTLAYQRSLQAFTILRIKANSSPAAIVPSVPHKNSFLDFLSWANSDPIIFPRDCRWAFVTTLPVGSKAIDSFKSRLACFQSPPPSLRLCRHVPDLGILRMR